MEGGRAPQQRVKSDRRRHGGQRAGCVAGVPPLDRRERDPLAWCGSPTGAAAERGPVGLLLSAGWPRQRGARLDGLPPLSADDRFT
ncbi:hypothetical protein NDU88_001073 [Pleurodeles waltl]|uniref:Uncharacterized protein n=1 Tax=Pleurodeles waltl TaxID=8319 RepID=A0AAV7TGS3_PLEWA|nr:hypothetical protein NDU88_001073 [Pleurodeles waltl]